MKPIDEHIGHKSVSAFHFEMTYPRLLAHNMDDKDGVSGMIMWQCMGSEFWRLCKVLQLMSQAWKQYIGPAVTHARSGR